MYTGIIDIDGIIKITVTTKYALIGEAFTMSLEEQCKNSPHSKEFRAVILPLMVKTEEQVMANRKKKETKKTKKSKKEE